MGSLSYIEYTWVRLKLLYWSKENKNLNKADMAHSIPEKAMKRRPWLDESWRTLMLLQTSQLHHIILNAQRQWSHRVWKGKSWIRNVLLLPVVLYTWRWQRKKLIRVPFSERNTLECAPNDSKLRLQNGEVMGQKDWHLSFPSGNLAWESHLKCGKWVTWEENDNVSWHFHRARPSQASRSPVWTLPLGSEIISLTDGLRKAQQLAWGGTAWIWAQTGKITKFSSESWYSTQRLEMTL